MSAGSGMTVADSEQEEQTDRTVGLVVAGTSSGFDNRRHLHSEQLGRQVQAPRRSWTAKMGRSALTAVTNNHPGSDKNRHHCHHWTVAQTRMVVVGLDIRPGFVDRDSNRHRLDHQIHLGSLADSTEQSLAHRGDGQSGLLLLVKHRQGHHKAAVLQSLERKATVGEELDLGKKAVAPDHCGNYHSGKMGEDHR